MLRAALRACQWWCGMGACAAGCLGKSLCGNGETVLGVLGGRDQRHKASRRARHFPVALAGRGPGQSASWRRAAKRANSTLFTISTRPLQDGRPGQGARQAEGGQALQFLELDLGSAEAHNVLGRFNQTMGQVSGWGWWGRGVGGGMRCDAGGCWMHDIEHLTVLHKVQPSSIQCALCAASAPCVSCECPLPPLGHRRQGRVVRIEKVWNPALWGHYQQARAQFGNEQQLWHGSSQVGCGWAGMQGFLCVRTLKCVRRQQPGRSLVAGGS